jgi:dipeptidyl aminopeptidase/acylaminoacyl peptidase|tara:strand:- start:4040 stop:5149 length:1110 start_codon:yes stop_codon:yes gene_type:complete
MDKLSSWSLILGIALASCTGSAEPVVEDGTKESSQRDSLRYNGEDHFSGFRQLTYGGDNAEAYWSFGNDKLVFQANNPSWGTGCDQIFTLELDDEFTPTSVPPSQISSGLGRTTCAYFMPGDTSVVFASTHLADTLCPAVPPRGPKGEYVWPIYEGYDIFTYDLDGNMQSQLTDLPGYDAEATVSPKGDRMVFTSTRSGDLELYTCNIDGTDVIQVTDELGYDGGAFFSPDGSQLIWRASRPKTAEEVMHYQTLLDKGLVEPTAMELFIGNADGSNARQLTDLGGANWAPFFHPSGTKILFSSNHHTGGFPFNIFMINTDGSGLKQISFDSAFDSFPMFSPDGKRLAFSSNRNNGRTRNTNVFVVNWVE